MEGRGEGEDGGEYDGGGRAWKIGLVYISPYQVLVLLMIFLMFSEKEGVGRREGDRGGKEGGVKF